MNYIETIFLIQISLIVLWETTKITLIRMGIFDSNYAVVLLMILSALAYVYLKKYLIKLKKYD